MKIIEFLIFGEETAYRARLTQRILLQRNTTGNDSGLKIYNRMKVVIADDSSLMRERIRELITGNTNVEVAGETGNGLKALELIRRYKPDLAIIDIRMPGMSGIAIINKIRELDINVKTCILTNYPREQYKKKCIEAGGDYFLSKADGFDGLASIINDLAG